MDKTLNERNEKWLEVNMYTYPSSNPPVIYDEVKKAFLWHDNYENTNSITE